MDGLSHRRRPARGNRSVRQHEMRTTELLLICDGKIRAEHRDDYARAIDHDLERLIHHSRFRSLIEKSPAMGAGLVGTKKMQARGHCTSRAYA